MPLIRFEKVVASLPSKLEPNTIYFVRVGTGFDLYVSDATGKISHKLNGVKPRSRLLLLEQIHLQM